MLPNTTVSAVCANTKAEKTQLYSLNPSRSATICGITVDTMVASTATIDIVAMTHAIMGAREERIGSGKRQVLQQQTQLNSIGREWKIQRPSTRRRQASGVAGVLIKMMLTMRIQHRTR